MQYSLNEICLLPSSTPTDITSRSQVNPFDEDGNLPIFVSPMTSVLNADNLEIFKQYKVIPIAPRNAVGVAHDNWTSLSLQQFESYIKTGSLSNTDKILIDIANGHIGKLYDLVIEAKYKWPNIIIMIGNIAHPSMYLECCKAGVDYVRVGIGGGSVCSTSVQCGIHASHQWMIEGIKEIRKKIKLSPSDKLVIYDESIDHTDHKLILRCVTKVIADGGINTLDKAIKCLALGYDYVMMGKCFAQCEEACGETRHGYYSNGSLQTGHFFHNEEYGKLFRKYYGMASEQGQIDISGGCNRNPEGIETWVEVNSTLSKFTTKFEAALRSTMSYVGAHNLEELRTQTQYDIMSIEEFKSYYK